MATGQAVLAAKDIIHELFMLINADDYYGKEAFVKIHEYLCEKHEPSAYCMAGFILKNKLSEYGGVIRGICTVDGDRLIDVVETSNIEKTIDGAAVDGVSVADDSYVFMNMWGFPAEDGKKPAYLDILEEGFVQFFEQKVESNPLKAEYLLPIHIEELLRDGKISVKVLETKDKWFGVTYKEYKEVVVQSFKKLIADGVYFEKLYSDL